MVVALLHLLVPAVAHARAVAAAAVGEARLEGSGHLKSRMGISQSADFKL